MVRQVGRQLHVGSIYRHHFEDKVVFVCRQNRTKNNINLGNVLELLYLNGIVIGSLSHKACQALFCPWTLSYLI